MKQTAEQFEASVFAFAWKSALLLTLLAGLFLAGTLSLHAQSYCRKPQTPSLRYCSNDGDWNDYTRCQNDNVDAINRYNQEVDEYNECVQQNQEAETTARRKRRTGEAGTRTALRFISRCV